MKIIRNIGIALLCCAILVSGQNVNNDDDDPTTTAATTTLSPSTTVSTSTTTTEPPPETTTTAPTIPTTTSTTVKPAPAPVPPTPTPSGPDYPRNNGKWSVEDSTNSTCIALKGAMQIVVHNKENKTVSVNIPALATSSGTCEEPQSLVLTWDSEVATKMNILTLSFEMNNVTKGELAEGSGITSGKFGLQNVTIELHLSSNATNSTTDEKISKSLVNIGKFQTPLKHSYSCLAEEAVKSATGDFSLKIREVQLEAYRVTAPGHREFSTAVQCPADDATDVVPIAVGAALAGLVVIVLIAYLIGRRRSRARGYQSV